MSQLIIGLTGGIGSGKTTVSDLFQAKGIDIIDADVVARAVVAPGQPALQQIVEHFGQDILNTDGNLDRAKLRHIVFADNRQKDWLNALLHPLIRQTMLSQCTQASSPYCILSAPLLVENKLTPLVHRVLVVDISEQKQLSRAAQRDHNSQQQIQQIMQAQASRQQRLAVADDIVDNNGTSDDLPMQIEQLHHHYLKIANQHNG